MSPILDTLSRLALSLQGAPAGASARVMEELRPWLGSLVRNAVAKWVPNLSYGFECSVPLYREGQWTACPGAAVAACDVCREPCCLAHARIDHNGDAICWRCVFEAQQARAARDAAPEPAAEAPKAQKPPPSQKDIVWARKELGVKASSTWEEVTTARRKMLAKWHPDRYQSSGAEAVAAAEERFKAVERAYQILSDVAARKEAA